MLPLKWSPLLYILEKRWLWSNLVILPMIKLRSKWIMSVHTTEELFSPDFWPWCLGHLRVTSQPPPPLPRDMWGFHKSKSIFSHFKAFGSIISLRFGSGPMRWTGLVWFWPWYRCGSEITCYFKVSQLAGGTPRPQHCPPSLLPFCYITQPLREAGMTSLHLHLLCDWNLYNHTDCILCEQDTIGLYKVWVLKFTFSLFYPRHLGKENKLFKQNLISSI